MIGFTADDLLARAGMGSFERGLDYVDQVDDLHRSARGIRATVTGSQPYDVLLTLDHERGVDGQCTCPYGEEGNFCKHCVAVALALLAAEQTGSPMGSADPPLDLDPIHRYLGTLSQSELADRLRAQAEVDPTLRRRLSLEASEAEAKRPRGVTLRFALSSTLTVRGALDYRESYAYAEAARDLCRELAGLLAVGRAADAVSLARRGVELLTAALPRVDDPSGAVGEVLDEFVALHARACALAPPDPGRLASWLIARAFERPDRPVDIAAYAPGLGVRGLAAYRRQLAARTHEERTSEATRAGSRGGRRDVLTRLRADLAEYEGDADQLDAILSAAGPTTDDQLRIATGLLAAGRAAEALDRAEHGLATAPWPVSGRLADFVVVEYVRTGRLDDAIAVRRHRFATHPSPLTYRDLHRTAALAGPDRGAADRDWALGLLETAAARSSGARTPTDPGSVLVRLRLADGEQEAAWDAYLEFGADESTELALAERRAVAHPADAIRILRAQVENLATTDQPRVYRRAAMLAARLRDCYQRAGDEPGWATYLEALVARHRRRLPFIVALDRRGLLPHDRPRGDPPISGIG
ncbi:MAG: SWIM zinc finger family protein [Sporichthyaceae bacterium]|nr:SWIM zinc finger family protein [Sporichthyaceae bacterium]